jgi:hypothetical protein
MAVRVLSHSVGEGEQMPPLIYERDQSEKNAMRRPYRIFLRHNATPGENDEFRK